MKSKQSMSGELFINQLIDIVQTYPSYLVVSLRSTSFVGIWFAYIHFLWPYCHCFALQYSTACVLRILIVQNELQYYK